MDKFTLSANLINGILQYLQTKPFNEVNGLIVGIQQEVQANAVPKIPVPTAPKSPDPVAPEAKEEPKPE
jgi:hypothetical protein